MSVLFLTGILVAPYTPAGKTRRKVYEFMRVRILEGRVPSVREVQKAFGFRAVQSAHRHLQALVDEGLLVRSRGRRSRAYRLPWNADPAQLSFADTWVPLLGRVQAGALTTALEDPEGYLAIAKRTASTANLFALRIRGESMRKAGIFDGDIVIVHRQSEAESGDIVVAFVGDEATVKRFSLSRGRVRLLPENDDFEPIIPKTDDFFLLGKVVEVRRYLPGSGGPPLREVARS